MMAKVQSEEAATRGRGRPRDELARKRILEAALAVLEESGFANATVDAIAERAGASKATVYRWWPNKAAVLIEAFREGVAPDLPFPNTGSFRNDIRQQLQNFARILTGWRGRVLAAFVSESQTDPEVAEAFCNIWIMPRRAEAKKAMERNRDRGELRPGIDLDLVLDLIYGPLYYRLLVANSTLSAEYAAALAEMALAGIMAASNKEI